jgi:hypothetical protein
LTVHMKPTPFRWSLQQELPALRTSQSRDQHICICCQVSSRVRANAANGHVAVRSRLKEGGSAKDARRSALRAPLSSAAYTLCSIPLIYISPQSVCYALSISRTYRVCFFILSSVYLSMFCKHFITLTQQESVIMPRIPTEFRSGYRLNLFSGV